MVMTYISKGKTDNPNVPSLRRFKIFLPVPMSTIFSVLDSVIYLI
jgi:hypothetical protein